MIHIMHYFKVCGLVCVLQSLVIAVAVKLDVDSCSTTVNPHCGCDQLCCFDSVLELQ